MCDARRSARALVLGFGVRNRWLIGCVVLALAACGGVTRSSPGGNEGGTSSSTGGTGSSTGGSASSRAGTNATAGTTTSVAGQPAMAVPCGKTFCAPGSICCNAVCGVCGSADGACPDIACGGTTQKDCRAFPPAPVVLGCVQQVGKPFDPNFSGVYVPEGQVTFELAGALEGGCLEPLLALQANGAALSAQAMSWTISDGKQQWDVEAVVEGNKIPSLGGQRVSLRYAYKFGGFGPTNRELSVVSRMSPSHGVWVFEAGDLPELARMPLALSRGAATCSTNEECGKYERYDLAATDPLSMKTLDVAHGQTARFGPWVVVHGGYEEQTSAGGCPDWFVADVHVAILGLM